MTKRTIAYTLAEARLLGSLTESQRVQYLAERKFEVVSNRGHRWLIDCSRTVMNVYRRRWWVLDNRSFCASLDWDMPAPDVWLAQALMLATDEARFRHIAHHLW